MNPALTGLLAGLSLIIAIGAQNAFVIRQGLARNHVLAIVLICALSDTALIFLGTAGLGTVVTALPWLIPVMRWLGVVYLLWFGVNTLRAMFKSDHLDASGNAKALTFGKAISTTLMLTWLNPHVYLDTLVFLGTLANQFGDARWLFAIGAATGSWLWFSGIGFGATRASKLMSKPLFWKILDGTIALVMFSIAAVLAFAPLG